MQNLFQDRSTRMLTSQPMAGLSDRSALGSLFPLTPILSVVCFSLIFGWLLALPLRAQDVPTGNAAEPARANERLGFLVDVNLPIVGERDETVRRQIGQIANANANATRRPVVVLRFIASTVGGDADNGGMRTRGSQFERCLSLARFLTSADASRVRLIAYLPESVEGHAVLPVLACEEILAAGSAELGRASVDEPLDATIEGAYRDVVSRRATLPEPVVMAMLLNNEEVYELGLTDGTSRTAGREETRTLRDEGRILEEKTVWIGGSLASFTGRQMRSRRWIGRTVVDESEVVSALGLSNSLRTVRQLPREWRPVKIPIDSELSATRVNQIVRALNEKIDEEQVNLAVFDFDSVPCEFQQAARLANYIAGLDSEKVYSLALVKEDLLGPIGLAAAACDEACLIGGSKLGPDPTKSLDLSDDSTQRFLNDLADNTQRPLALLSALLSSDVRVQEFIHQQNGKRAIFANWQVGLQADAGQWLAKQTIAGGDPIPSETALQYRLVDAADESASLPLSRLGIDEMPEELRSPWLDSSIEMVLAQGWLPRLLLTIGFFALMAELGSPGLGVGGFLSALCFLGFFWVEGLNGNVEALEVILFVAGLIALLMEIFVVPGFGVFGIGGLVMLFVSVVLASQTFIWPTTSQQLSEIASNLFWTACMALGGMIGLLVMHKQLERLPMFRWISLLPEDPEEQDQRESLSHREHLLDQEGLTTTRLNPSGKAQFGRDIVPVVGNGHMIDQGVPVRVIEVRGNLVLVEPY